MQEFKKTLNVTAVFGILSFATLPVTVMLYFMYTDEAVAPPVWNVLLRTLISIFALLFTVVFFSGFKHTLKSVTKDCYWPVSLMYTLVCIWVATAFVAHSLEAGGVYNPDGAAVDATQDGVLAQGNYLLYGSIGRMLMAAFMVLAGLVTFKTKIFPKWTGWVAVAIGAVNAAFIPSMFCGTNAGDFYSAIGWGNSAVAAGLFTVWVFIISIVMLKDKHKYAPLAGNE